MSRTEANRSLKMLAPTITSPVTTPRYSSGPLPSRVEVVVRYRSETAVPLVGRLVGDVELTGRATMRVE